MQMKRALVLAGDEKLVHYEASLPIYMENFSKYCLKDVEPYDGIRELLASLKKMGVHVAVLSNKPHEQAIIHTNSSSTKHIAPQITMFPASPSASALHDDPHDQSAQKCRAPQYDRAGDGRRVSCGISAVGFQEKRGI